MLLLRKQTQFYVLILAFFLIGVHTQEDNSKAGGVPTKEEPKPQKDVGKTELPPQTVQSANAEEVVVIGPKSDVGNTNEQKRQEEGKQQAQQKQQGTEKTGIKSQGISTDDKTSTAAQLSSAAPASSASSSSVFYHQDETILGSNEEISDSLKNGFYFFVALSLSAILFIVFKVYRLRLSRAERKYGVQGDRSTQELTPLPIGIEDGHSDDDDQTVFEVNRQNIRIL